MSAGVEVNLYKYPWAEFKYMYSYVVFCTFKARHFTHVYTQLILKIKKNLKWHSNNDNFQISLTIIMGH